MCVFEFSPSIEKISAYTRAALIGKSIYELYADGRQRDALIERILKKERFRTFFSSVNDAIFVHPMQPEGFAPFIEVVFYG